MSTVKLIAIVALLVGALAPIAVMVRAGDTPAATLPPPSPVAIAPQGGGQRPELVITVADNGKTVRAGIGQTIVVTLAGDRANAGWEVSQPQAASVIPVTSGGRIGNQDIPALEFTAAVDAKSPESGSYAFRYRAVAAGSTTLVFSYLTPGGPVPKARTATGKLGEMRITIAVVDAGSDDSAAAGNPIDPLAIDLATAFGTMGDPRMQPMRRGVDAAGKPLAPYGAHLDGLYRQLSMTGVSNIALVSAADLNQAIEEVHLLLGVMDDHRSRRTQHGQRPWLFLFCGVAGSSPPVWSIDSITIREAGTIEVMYQRRVAGAETKDRHPYFALIPLPKDLPAGSYTLRLIDCTDGTIDVQRRGVVREEQPPRKDAQPAKPVVPHVPRTPAQQQADADLKRQLEGAGNR